MRQPLSLYIRAARLGARRFYGKLERRARRAVGRKAAEDPRGSERVTVSMEELRAALRDLEIAPGDTVLVHSGISHLGKIIGGPRAVFEAIQAAVGDRGHVLYPVFPFDSLMYTYLASQPTFDVRTAPTRMGAVTAYAQKVAGGRRSVHPTHSVLGFGPNAGEFVDAHHLCSTPFADRSPFARLVDVRGKILLLGVGLNSTTSFHRTEDRLGDSFPVKVYRPEAFTIACVNNDGDTVHVTTPAHDPFVSRARDCDLVRPDFVEKGVIKEVNVGTGRAAAIDAVRMDELLEALLKQRRRTIYGRIWG
jgi:aminoglycoside 3-N-acetyltransferase